MTTSLVAARKAEITNEDVKMTGFRPKTKVSPPLLVPNPDKLVDDEMTKSGARPVVGPFASDTESVQVMGELIREGLIFKHDSREAVVGLPYTTNDERIPLIKAVSEMDFTAIKCDEVMEAGVTENANVSPPSDVVSVVTDDDDVAIKSELTPVVGPVASATEMVQSMVSVAREGAIFEQERLDALVGVPYTTNRAEPFAIGVLATPTRTETVKKVVRAVGVTENVNVYPPLAVLKAVVDSVEETLKSDLMPVVAPIAPETLIVHTTGKPRRDGLMLMHDKLLSELGFPYTANTGEPLVRVRLDGIKLTVIP